MSSQKQHVTIRDLAEEAKKRIVVLVICVVGLSYLMSLTSSSVWVNLPAAASLILVLRYLSLDFETKRKAAAYNSRQSSENTLSQKKAPERPKVVDVSAWRRKVKSPVVEDAIDHLTRHIVSEWVTDLWYSRLTPDKEGPEELVQIINGVLGEISARMRNINLIDLLTRATAQNLNLHMDYKIAMTGRNTSSGSDSSSTTERTQLESTVSASKELDLCYEDEWDCPTDSVRHKKIEENDRVYVFLAGLNKELDEVRGRILGRKPLPSIREVFSKNFLTKTRLYMKTRAENISDRTSLVPSPKLNLTGEKNGTKTGTNMLTYSRRKSSKEKGPISLHNHESEPREEPKQSEIPGSRVEEGCLLVDESPREESNMGSDGSATRKKDCGLQLDVKNAFLNGDLEEEVYMASPPGFEEKFDSKVCKLKKSLYGLKQSPRVWFEKFTHSVKNQGYVQVQSDHTMFMKHSKDGKVAVLIVYVDDIILTGNDVAEMEQLKRRLASEFEIKDLGTLKYFLGMEVARSRKGIVVSQRKYVLDLLKETGMSRCKPADTPLDPNQTLGDCKDGAPIDTARYQKLKGEEKTIEVYTDADWASSITDRRSTSGYCTFVWGNLVTWRSKKHNVVSRSSAEAEYRAMAHGVCEILWIERILDELRRPVEMPMKLYCDNKAAISIAHNPVQHDRTKHVEIDRHFIKEKLEMFTGEWVLKLIEWCRDLINLICTYLELFRATQAKVKKQAEPLTSEHLDIELRLVLAAENKLHPALFSAEAEHKVAYFLPPSLSLDPELVLQHVMDGLISFTFRPEDLQCSFFRYVSRELLACAVIRPVLNLASPRFINERIESLVINMTKSKQAVSATHEEAQPKSDGPTKISPDHFSKFLDPSVKGVELVQLNNNKSRGVGETQAADCANGNLSKDPLLSIDTRSTRSWSPLPMNSENSDEGGLQRHRSGGEWGDMLDMISRRKTQALAPEHLENMWTKGRDYKRKEGENRLIEEGSQGSSHATVTKLSSSESSYIQSRSSDHFKEVKSSRLDVQDTKSFSLVNPYQEDDEQNLMLMEEVELGSSTSYTSEEEENSSVMGLNSPGTKVWNGRNNRNKTISHIHHPLEDAKGRKKTAKGHVHYQRLHKTHSGRKRFRPSNDKVHIWQEVERTSFLSGDGQDILGSSIGHASDEDFSGDSDMENLGRAHSGAAASSSAPSTSVAERHGLVVNSLKNSLAVDSFYKLRCEVLGANIVKSGSRTFAVYSISVTDVNNNSWSIKRRFRHFEELHRRLKIFSEYNLHLPPKHFLSTGLDVPVIQERCKLLDDYLKKLMQLPTISGSIEVWDFLSVDSQTYIFSNSFSIVETLSVDLNGKPSEKNKGISNSGGPVNVTDLSTLKREHLRNESREPALQMKNNAASDGFRLNVKGLSFPPSKIPGKEFDNSGSDSETRAPKDPSSLRNLGRAVKGKESHSSEAASELPLDAAADLTLPTEWVPPNVSVPILDLVDVIFQLQDGGWIRRKAFWVAKQVLQLGMGDAFDDWLIEKIQLLRKGRVVASGIKRLEQILWPDGIFLTKHPKRRPPPSANASQSSPNGQQHAEVSSPRMDDEQQQEANRRAKFVYELMIDKAPAAIVGLVGHKEYEQCAKDLYFFLQSSVCLKQLAFDLLELLLLSAFPELDYIFKQLHDEKHKFVESTPS
ncbi:Copia protein [Morus notabilis]|uniref:Copia protein n=1 Tax=Morus notabilis TaxID=981085 RepID=W9REE0_9ROSA|nr:Copia protein [Morus notabilis]